MRSDDGRGGYDSTMAPRAPETESLGKRHGDGEREPQMDRDGRRYADDTEDGDPGANGTLAAP